MSNREKLILHLQNLLKSKTKSATIDVVFLLEILNALPEPEITKSFPLRETQLDVDGGKFT